MLNAYEPMALAETGNLLARGLGESLHKKRLYLEEQLQQVGFRVLPAQGTYFLVADFR